MVLPRSDEIVYQLIVEAASSRYCVVISRARLDEISSTTTFMIVRASSRQLLGEAAGHGFATLRPLRLDTGLHTADVSQHVLVSQV